MGCETVGVRIPDSPLCTIRTEERTLVIDDDGYVHGETPDGLPEISRVVLEGSQRGQTINNLERLMGGPLAGIPIRNVGHFNRGAWNYQPILMPSVMNPLTVQEMRNIANQFRAYGVVVREDAPNPELAIDVGVIGAQTMAGQLWDGVSIRPECTALL